MYIGDKRPWWNPTTDPNDFRLLDKGNCVRLVNFIFNLRTAANPAGSVLDTTPAVARVLRFIEAHQSSCPASPGRCRWESIDALISHTQNSGPTCSAGDIAYAVSLLPAPGLTSAQSWDSPVQKTYNTEG